MVVIKSPADNNIGFIGFTSLEQLRKQWQEQEDHPLTEPCPRCGSMKNHAVNIDAVLKESAKNLADEIDRRAGLEALNAIG